MRKRFLPNYLGENSKFWEKIWMNAELQAALRFCESDPLRKIFENFFPAPPAKILEAGCGLGHILMFYRNKGYDIEGIDYARETVERLLTLDSSLPVKVGNVGDLPYPDNYFGAYYSGGVVEHSEKGPDSILKEAYRVLCDDGILIITVPYLNLTRSCTDLITSLLFGKNKIIRTIDIDGFLTVYFFTKDCLKGGPYISDFHFHEYWYSNSEFKRILTSNGFEIIFSKKFNILGGLCDYKLFRKILGIDKRKENKVVDSNKETEKSYVQMNSLKNYAKSLLVQEKEESIVGRLMLPFLKTSFAHMIAFVCRAKK